MEEYEREYLDAVADNFAASIASGMRAADDEPLFEDESALTEGGQLWAQGYLTGRLSMIRSGSTGNPNLSTDDLEAVAALVERNESNIAAQLYG